MTYAEDYRNRMVLVVDMRIPTSKDIKFIGGRCTYNAGTGPRRELIPTRSGRTNTGRMQLSGNSIRESCQHRTLDSGHMGKKTTREGSVQSGSGAKLKLTAARETTYSQNSIAVISIEQTTASTKHKPHPEV